MTFLLGRRSTTNVRTWRMDGTWEQINHKRNQWVRVSEGRETSPSAAILDSQSVKTATPAAVEVGYDAAKQVKGRKRHLLVDTFGWVLMVVVTAASVPERQGARQVFARKSAGAALGESFSDP